MKKLIFLIPLTLIIAFTLVTHLNFSPISNKKNTLDKDNPLSYKKTFDQPFRVKNMLNDVTNDLITTYKINTKSYKVLNLETSDLNEFSNGTYPGLEDFQTVQEICAILHKELRLLPDRTFAPRLLVRNDKKEFIIIYKDMNGKNYKIQYTKLSNSYHKDQRLIVQGKKFHLDKYLS